MSDDKRPSTFDRPRRFYAEHKVAWFAIFTVACIVSVFIWKIPQAIAADAGTQSFLDTSITDADWLDDSTNVVNNINQPGCAYVDGDGGCWTPADLARRFRNGKYTGTHGYDASKVYANKVDARTAWVKKITVKVTNMSVTHRNMVRKHLGLVIPTAEKVQPVNDTTDVTVGRARCTDSFHCIAAMAYDDNVQHATCATRRNHFPNIDVLGCTPGPGSGGMGTDGIVKLGAVVFCGGTVVIGIATSSLTFAGTAFVAAWGATSCSFSFWAAFR